MKESLCRMTLMAFAILISTGLFAQNKMIQGKVTDAELHPLHGVTVSIKNNPEMTVVSNEEGLYKINAAIGDTLVFSFIGYSTTEMVVKNTAHLDISMQSEYNNLNDVVVIGYGTRQKKDLTGSVSQISAKDFQKGAITTPEQLISGKSPGVSIISNGGQPGGGSTIRIRGGSSLNASNDPLIVIDGVPLDNSGVSGASNPLSLINPNDIESFTILKDASAAAIYGTRASNGVIIITTKKGVGGSLKVNFSSVNSVSRITKEVDVLSADQFRSIVNAKGTTAKIAMLGSASTDWQKQIYRSAFSTDNNISISGGIHQLPYRLSVGYLDQDGILKTDGLKRTAVSLALNPVLFDNSLKININLKGIAEQTRFGNRSAIGGAVSFDPTQPVYSESPRFGGYFEWLDPSSQTGLQSLAGRNPVGLLFQRQDLGKPLRSIGNIQLDYSFPYLPDLHANLNLGYDLSKSTGTVYVSDSAAAEYMAGGLGGENNHYKQTKKNSLLEFYLSYSKDLSDIKSRFDVLAGYSYNDYQTKNYNYASYYANGTKLPNSDPSFPFDIPEHSLLSYFGRLNFTYNENYLLTATLRRDGSSRFGPANKWGMFPSVALAWKIKDEKYGNAGDFLSSLKLRVGYGITGQQDGINNYDFLSFYSLSNATATYQLGDNFYQMYRPSGYNPGIKWEQTATTNVGIDYGFAGNRITGSLDLYYKKTSDLLNNIPQPAGSNFSAYQIANVGDMNNKGIEFNINAAPVHNSRFSWSLNFNATYNKNTITNLTVVPDDPNYIGFPGGGIAGGIGGQNTQINAVGGPKNTFYLYQQIYDKNGLPIEGVFLDKNGDNIINQDDLNKSKSADPKFFFGFSSDFSYKKWNAGFVLRSSVGNYVYNNTYSATGTLNQITGNSVLYNASSNYLQSNFVGNSLELLSDYYLQNASFLKMDNLYLGYHFNKSIRVSATVQNVFVITKYKGLDPEISSGVDNNLYPRPRVFSLGVNLDL